MARSIIMKTHLLPIFIQCILWCLPLLSFGQTAGQMRDATPTQPSGEAMSAPNDGLLDLSNLGAKMVFLAFLAIFAVLYMYIRRQPTSQELKKQKKKKR